MRWFAALIGFFIGVSLLWLGTPRVIASVLKAPAFMTLLSAHHGIPQPLERLEKATGYLKTAAQWEDSGRIRTDLGFLLLLQATQIDPADPRRSALARQAAEALREGLVRAPAQPHSWLRLAYARVIETGPSPEIAALLARSVEAGPFVGEITISRLELLLRTWHDLSPDLRSYARKQVRYAWKNDYRGLIKAAKRSDRAYIIRFALRAVPGALDQFDAAIPRNSD